MSNTDENNLSRRDLLKTSGKVAAATALAGAVVPHVHASTDETVQIALIGCGGRGTGAAENALSTVSGPTRLVAMADVFEDRLNESYDSLHDQLSRKGQESQIDVPPERKFIGFDAYQKAMDCLRPGDVAIFATPPAFRWVHFGYAIDKDLNVFMEKPISVDGPSSRKMFELGERAKQKNLKVGVGLMCRHCAARGELFERIQDGQIGDVLLLRAYRCAGPTGSGFTRGNRWGMNDLLFQIRRFHAFLWASGGAFSDFLIHNIDECCWMKDAWPVEAKGFGGRHYRGDYVDQNFDTYNVEYTFADGTKLELVGRCMTGCHSEFASYAHGTKGAAVISTASHAPSHCRIFKGQVIHPHTRGRRNTPEDLVWRYPDEEPSPYQLEWDHLIDAIRHNKPYNEVERGAEASLVTAMGRLAAHTGQVITRDQMFNHEHELGAGVDKLTLESDSPLMPNAEGKYPLPLPGILTDREYRA